MPKFKARMDVNENEFMHLLAGDLIFIDKYMDLDILVSDMISTCTDHKIVGGYTFTKTLTLNSLESGATATLEEGATYTYSELKDIVKLCHNGKEEELFSTYLAHVPWKKKLSLS